MRGDKRVSKILAAREAGRTEREAKGEPAPGRRANSPPSKADTGLDAPRALGGALEGPNGGVRVVGVRQAKLGMDY